MMRKRVRPRRCFLKLFAIVALTAIPIGLALPGNPGARADAAGPAADPPDQNVSNTSLILLGPAGGPIQVSSRSEERRVGTECGSKGRYRWEAVYKQKKKNN